MATLKAVSICLKIHVTLLLVRKQPYLISDLFEHFILFRKENTQCAHPILKSENVLDLSYVVDENSPRELPIDPVKIYDQATLEKDGYFESRVDMSGHCCILMHPV